MKTRKSTALEGVEEPPEAQPAMQRQQDNGNQDETLRQESNTVSTSPEDRQDPREAQSARLARLEQAMMDLHQLVRTAVFPRKSVEQNDSPEDSKIPRTAEAQAEWTSGPSLQ